MRSKVFRFLAGLIAVLFAVVFWMSWRDGDIVAGDLALLIGMPLLFLLFIIYALRGQRAADRALLPIMRLAELPEWL